MERVQNSVGEIVMSCEHQVYTYYVKGSKHERGQDDVEVCTIDRELTAQRLRAVGYQVITTRNGGSIPADQIHLISPYGR